jgi:FlaA1/EpsC-like NDP-sugar epimerase
MSELKTLSKTGQCQLIPILISILDKKALEDCLNKWMPDTIYHAAAYKHVELVEQNAGRALKNNVLGTLNLAESAIANSVKVFVLISSDKAVRPTSVMGASKRLSELIVQSLADKQSDTSFTSVRFGNVLGSSGSVVPKFKQQIMSGGPVTVTHKDVTRYFMTIKEAAELVIQAGAMSKGGEVFLLDMGMPIKIDDLARQMINLAGLSVKDEDNAYGQIEICYTGLVPGEKMYEELFIGSKIEKTPHPRIMIASEDFISWAELEKALIKLFTAAEEGDHHKIKKQLSALVAGY